MGGPVAEPRWQLVLLAAGRSSRMGEPKGLVVFRGRPWIEHQLRAVSTAGVARVVVVLGFDRERYLAGIETAARAAHAAHAAHATEAGLELQVAINDAPERGPFSSLQCGLGRVDPAAPVFVLPVDVPAAEPAVWHALSAALGSAPHSWDAAVPVLGLPGLPGEGGGGHPVLLASTFAARLLQEPEDSRLDLLLRQRDRQRDRDQERDPDRPRDRDTAVIRVPVSDRRVRLNLNRPEDWGRLDEE